MVESQYTAEFWKQWYRKENSRISVDSPREKYTCTAKTAVDPPWPSSARSLGFGYHERDGLYNPNDYKLSSPQTARPHSRHRTLTTPRERPSIYTPDFVPAPQRRDRACVDGGMVATAQTADTASSSVRRLRLADGVYDGYLPPVNPAHVFIPPRGVQASSRRLPWDRSEFHHFFVGLPCPETKIPLPQTGRRLCHGDALQYCDRVLPARLGMHAMRCVGPVIRKENILPQ